MAASPRGVPCDTPWAWPAPVPSSSTHHLVFGHQLHYCSLSKYNAPLFDNLPPIVQPTTREWSPAASKHVLCPPYDSAGMVSARPRVIFKSQGLLKRARSSWLCKTRPVMRRRGAKLPDFCYQKCVCARVSKVSQDSVARACGLPIAFVATSVMGRIAGPAAAPYRAGVSAQNGEERTCFDDFACRQRVRFVRITPHKESHVFCLSRLELEVA